jgi:thioredoxin-related protein
MSDLGNTRALILVFAMPGCHACHDYLPRLEKELKRWRANGAQFEQHEIGKSYTRGQIPVAIFDATSKDAQLQALCDAYQISSMPTTILLMHNAHPVRHEGAISDQEIYDVLLAATNANR